MYMQAAADLVCEYILLGGFTFSAEPPVSPSVYHDLPQLTFWIPLVPFWLNYPVKNGLDSYKSWYCTSTSWISPTFHNLSVLCTVFSTICHLIQLFTKFPYIYHFFYIWSSHPTFKMFTYYSHISSTFHYHTSGLAKWEYRVLVRQLSKQGVPVQK